MNSFLIFAVALIVVATAQPNTKPIYGSACHQAVQNANRAGPALGRSVPECDEFGNYAARQCKAGTQFCQCVAHDGKPLTELRKDIDSCECIRKVSDAKSSNSRPLLGAFIPTCKDNGSYEKKQCHPSTGLCWCADAYGKQLGDQVRGPLTC